MIGFLNALLSVFSQITTIIENYYETKKSRLERDQHSKAEAYDKLQKALKARNSARKSIAVDGLMPDDKFERK